MGVGILGGAGLGVDNAGGANHGVNLSPSHEVGGGVGFSLFGANASLPNNGGVGHPSINYNSPAGSAGVAVGPHLGLAFGSTKTANFTARSSSPCD